MRTLIGLSAGHTSRQASNTCSGKRARACQRPAVGVGAHVRQRRQEARQQVAVRAVELEQVEARLDAPARGQTNCSSTASMSACVISRGTWLQGEYGDRRGRDHLPVAVVERLVDPEPHQLRRPLAARVAELGGHRAVAVAVREVDDPLPRVDVLGAVHARAPGRDPPDVRDADHLGVDERRAAERARPEVDEVEVRRRPVDRRVHVHRRDDHAVGQLERAQLERREHRRALGEPLGRRTGHRPRRRTPRRAAAGCRRSRGGCGSAG